MINGLLNRNKRGIGHINRIVDNDGTTRIKSNEIAEIFKKYFCNIASTLKQNSNSPESFETNSCSVYTIYLSIKAARPHEGFHTRCKSFI